MIFPSDPVLGLAGLTSDPSGRYTFPKRGKVRMVPIVGYPWGSVMLRVKFSCEFWGMRSVKLAAVGGRATCAMLILVVKGSE